MIWLVETKKIAQIQVSLITGYSLQFAEEALICLSHETNEESDR